MRINMRTAMIFAFLIFQWFFLSHAENSFTEATQRDRNRVTQELVAKGMPEQQMRAISGALLDQDYQIARYVSSLGFILQMTTIIIFMWSTGASNRNAPPPHQRPGA